MKSFARVTKLHNVVGRAAYIADPKRQEQVLVNMGTDEVIEIGWRAVAAFERSHRRTSKANNEAREVIIQLPNEWADYPPQLLSELCSDLAITAVNQPMPFMEFAVHWNHARTNLHMHVIFSERTMTGDLTKRYDRDIYLTQDGKVARRRADRARDQQGDVLPPVHRKGDLVNPAGFSPKNKEFTSRAFPAAVMQRVEARLLALGVAVEQRCPYMLHEYHEGKGTDAPLIRDKNAGIRAYNACIAFLMQEGINSPQVLKTLLRAAQADLCACQPPRVHVELWHDPAAQQAVAAMCKQALAQYRDKNTVSLSQRLEWANQEATRQNAHRHSRGWGAPGLDR